MPADGTGRAANNSVIQTNTVLAAPEDGIPVSGDRTCARLGDVSVFGGPALAIVAHGDVTVEGELSSGSNE